MDEVNKYCAYCGEPMPVDVEIDDPAKQFVLCEECLEMEMERYQPKKKVEFNVGDGVAYNLLFHDEDPSLVTMSLEQDNVVYLTGGYDDLRKFLFNLVLKIERMK